MKINALSQLWLSDRHIKLVFSRPLVTRWSMSSMTTWTWALIIGVLSQRLSFWCWSCIELVIIWGFSMTIVNIFCVGEWNCDNIAGWIFIRICFEWLSFAWQFAPLSSGAWRFVSTDITQDSVAMHFRCGGIFYYHLTTNVWLSLLTK